MALQHHHHRLRHLRLQRHLLSQLVVMVQVLATVLVLAMALALVPVPLPSQYRLHPRRHPQRLHCHQRPPWWRPPSAAA